MTKKAFTLIELLIVITIIALISASGIFYFFRQVSSIKIAGEIEKVIDIVDNLDGQIDSRKILDYSLNINKNSLGFTGSINNLGLDSRQNINMNFETGTGIIQSNSGTILKIYSGVKLQKSETINSSGKTSFDFSTNIDGKILANYSGETLNNLVIYYFSPDNLIKNNENKLELIGIYDNNNKTGTSYNSVIIKNINGKKGILAGGSEINIIYLFFEREGVEKFIEIKK